MTVTTLMLRETVEKYLYTPIPYLAECCQAVLREKPPFVSEKLLYHIWEYRHFNSNSLTTVDGRPVEILEWGQRSHFPDPDFLNAKIKINGKIREGAVEMHLTTQDWFIHNHHLDPHYNCVVLHVVLWHQANLPIARKKNGHLVPTLGLAGYLNDDLKVIHDYLAQITENLGFPCQELIAKSGLKLVLPKVRVAGHNRIHAKSEQFQQEFDRCQSWDQVLYQGIAAVLGYSRNKESFDKLTRTIVPYHKLHDYILSLPNKSVAHLRQVIFGILLGASGLLVKTESDASPQEKPFLDNWQRSWERWQHNNPTAAMSMEEWVFRGLRPANYPTRRLAALTELLLEFFPDTLQQGFLSIIGDKPSKTVSNFHRVLSLKLDSSLILLLKPGEKPHNQTLIGVQRRYNILVNIIFPILMAYARQEGQQPLQNALDRLQPCLTGDDNNHIIRSFNELWNLSREEQKFLREAVVQQGLIEIDHRACQWKLCQRCPLTAGDDSGAE